MKTILPIVVSLIALLPSTAAAEAPQAPAVRDLSIQIMPEHDQPSRWQSGAPALLVGYYGTLVNASDRTFNEPVVFELPIDEPNFLINMICETERGMVCLPYEIDPATRTVSWRLSRALEPGQRMPFMLEYYSNPFTDGPQKKFDFAPIFPGPTTGVIVDVVEPARSSAFSVAPAPDRTFTREDGFVAHRLQFADVGRGEGLKMTVSYVKPDNLPSVSSDAPASPAQAPPPVRQAQDPDVLLGVGIAIAASIALLGVLLFFGMRSRASAGRTNRSTKSTRGGSGGARNREQEKRKAMRLLLDGKISESTYKRILKEL